MATATGAEAWAYAQANPDDTRIQIDRGLCKGSLVEFVKRAWSVVEPAAPYVHGKAIEVLCEALEAVTRGDIKRLLINIPPGTGKSLITSVLWPAWEWGPRGMAHLRYLGVAHNLELAMRDTAKMRRLVHSDWYQKLSLIHI